MTLGADVCNCEVPCIRYQYDAILSSSLLDSYKIRDEIKVHEKSRELLPRYQEAVEISAQVKTFPHEIIKTLQMFFFRIMLVII